MILAEQIHPSFLGHSSLEHLIGFISPNFHWALSVLEHLLFMLDSLHSTKDGHIGVLHPKGKKKRSIYQRQFYYSKGEENPFS